jgi:hypothetical protein
MNPERAASALSRAPNPRVLNHCAQGPSTFEIQFSSPAKRQNRRGGKKANSYVQPSTLDMLAGERKPLV